MLCVALILIVTVAIQLNCLVEGAFSTIVASGGEECFIVRAPPDVQSTISGNYDCLDDDLSPNTVGAILYDSKMTPVWRSQPKAAEGSFFIQGSGKYELCFQNGREGADDYLAEQDGKDREVGFALRVIPPQRAMDGEAGPDDRLTSNLVQMSVKLMQGLQTMTDHQEYMRERENKHTVLAEKTFERVVQWTMLEAVVLILISCGQVLYLRKFFEQRRYL